MRPKILLSVLCGSSERTHWINPLLFDSLMALQIDSRLRILNIPAYAIDRVEVARNRCVQFARDDGAEILVMCDNDMTLPPDFGSILLEVISSGKPIVGFRSARVMAKDWSIEPLAPIDAGQQDGNFQQTGQVGAGLLILSSEVWRVIPRGPWFSWQYADDELLSRKASEDYAFCELAQSRGLTVWCHRSTAGHLKTCDITKFLGE